MGFAYCCSKSCQSFCTCLGKIPYGTGFGITIASVGMFLFIGGCVSSMGIIKESHSINVSKIDSGYTFAGVLVGTGIFLALFVLIFACYSNMEAENNIFDGVIPKFCGKFLSSFLMVVEYILYLAWAMMTIFMVFPAGLQLFLSVICKNGDDIEKHAMATFLNASSSIFTINANDTDATIELCKSIEKIKSPSIVALVGTFLAALGTVHVLMCLSANFAYVNSLEKTRKEQENKEPEYKKPKSTGLFNSVQIDD